MKTIHLLFSLALCLIGSSLFAQDGRIYKIEGTVFDKTDGKPLDGYIVEIYEKNNIVHSPDRGKKGRFEASLSGGTEYTFDISLNGYYPKRIVFKATAPGDVKKIPVLKFETELIRKSDYELIEKVDIFSTSIFDLPYVIFEWNNELGEFSYRESYTEHMKQKYAEVSDLR